MMKYLLLIPIRIYWLLIPEVFRRRCLFRESCSRYVFRITSEKGIIQGCKALLERYRQCRVPYHVEINTDGSKELHLCNGDVVSDDHCAENILEEAVNTG